MKTISDAEFYSWRTTKGWITRRGNDRGKVPAADWGQHPALLDYVSQRAPVAYSKIITKLGRLA